MMFYAIYVLYCRRRAGQLLSSEIAENINQAEILVTNGKHNHNVIKLHMTWNEIVPLSLADYILARNLKVGLVSSRMRSLSNADEENRTLWHRKCNNYYFS